MKKQLLLLTCAVGFMMPLPGVAEEESPLGNHMEAMNDAYKAFRRETDPAKGAALARDAQQAALKSAVEIPSMLAKMPESPEKAKALVEYRKMIGQLFVSFCEVEQAFLSGKIEDVAKIVESLKEQKKTGHDRFMEE